MTVPQTSGRVFYIGDGVTTNFPIPFTYTANETGYVHLNVSTSDLEGLDTKILRQYIDFTITPAWKSNGNITLVNPLPINTKLTIIYNIPFEQSIDRYEFGRLPSESIEKAEDLSVLRDIQLNEEVKRCLKIPPESSKDTKTLISDIFKAKETCQNQAELSTAEAENSKQSALESEKSKNEAMIWAVGSITARPEGSSKYWAEVAAEIAKVMGNPANRDLSNLSPSGQSKLDDKVSKTANETISGSKSFEKQVTINGASAALKISSTNSDEAAILFIRENIGAGKIVLNSLDSVILFRKYDNSDYIFLKCKTADTSSNSDIIATTKFVNDFLELKKGNIVDWGLPDYSSYITLGAGSQTAQYSGFLMVTPDARLGQSKFAINIGSKIYYPYQGMTGSDYEHVLFFSMPIKKGIPFNITELSGCTAQFFRFLYN